MIPCEHWSATVRGGRCAAGKFGGTPSAGVCGVCLAADGKVFDVPAPSEEGRARWLALHTRALAWDGREPEAEIEFVGSLADGLEGCSCAKHWRELVECHPPELSSPAAYFAWTVWAHNAVNGRIGKQIVTLPKAASLVEDALAALRVRLRSRLLRISP